MSIEDAKLSNVPNGFYIKHVIDHGNNVVNNFTEFTLKGLINGLFHFSSIQFGWKDERISRFRMLVMALSLIKKNIINYVRKNT